jgi:hypothetical protein
MKENVIQNQYDGPRIPERRLIPVSASQSVSLDYVNSNNAQDLDNGIRANIQGVRLSILGMGIALAKIKAQGLYIDLQYHSMAKYIEQLAEDTKMDRSGIFNWLYVGEAYLEYRSELEKIGFTDEDGPTKLPYVTRALECHPKREVFKSLKTMSRRAFIEYAKGDTEDTPSVPPSKIRVKGNNLYVGNKPAVTFADDLDPKTREYLIRLNVEAG